MQLPLFALNTVLYPGGLLPLKIFEQRYMDMAKQCLRDESPFVVCAIQEGGEVGTPAVPARMGCVARILEWDMPQLGVLHVLARGGERARVASYEANAAGLLIGAVELLENEPVTAISDEYSSLSQYGKAFEEYTDERFKPSTEQLTDAVWLGYRLCEMLPLPLNLKQHLLELPDANARLRVMRELLRRAGEGEAD
jgi:uncharacterized protein